MATNKEQKFVVTLASPFMNGPLVPKCVFSVATEGKLATAKPLPHNVECSMHAVPRGAKMSRTARHDILCTLAWPNFILCAPNLSLHCDGDVCARFE